MNCPKCNKPVQADARFCRYCGANLEMATSTTNSTIPNDNKNTSPSGGKKRFALIIGCVVAAFLIGGIAFLLVNRIGKTGTADMKQEEISGTGNSSQSGDTDSNYLTGKEPKEKVTFTDIKFEKQEFYREDDESDFSTFVIRSGYVITGTAKNDTDQCVDLSPKISAHIKYKDEYGDDQERDEIIGIEAGTYSPDSRFCYDEVYDEDEEEIIYEHVHKDYLQPVGLLPNEEKQVKYYVVMEEETITEITIVDTVWEPVEDVVYMPSSTFSDLKMVRGDGFDISMIYTQATILNETNDRWEAVYANIEYVYEDKPILEEHHAMQDHVGIGKPDSYKVQSFVGTIKMDYESAIPSAALVWYVPEQKEE